MALFKAEDILSNRSEEKVIACDFFVLPEDAEIPTITIEINDKIMKIANKAANSYCGDVRIIYTGKGTQAEGKIINDRESYCRVILSEAYLNSSGLFENPSKKAILALLQKQPTFARKLAGKLLETFESSELYVDEVEDRKN